LAIGKGLKTKVNVNIGTSTDYPQIKPELEKLKVSLEYETDAVMDLSTGGDLKKVRKEIMKRCPVSLGTVPIYEAVVNLTRQDKQIEDMKIEDLLKVIKQQAEEGVDFMTLHCGLTYQALQMMKKQKRLLNIVSRGGAFLAKWMLANNKENLLYENYDKILEILHEYDIVISLGDGLRPGCIKDASDRAQFQELIVLGELAKRANEKGVQAIIEGPGHVPIDQIKMNIDMEKQVCSGAPFYVLGPLVTDSALGYDHFSSAIGAALAGSYGADFLCYLTPAEHLGLPTKDDVKIGLIATKIAAHAADVAKHHPRALKRDERISAARRQRNFKKQIDLALFPEKPQSKYKELKSKQKDVCSMCAEFCAIKIIEEALRK
jgi:phosphomethylpyrimidine synthase